MQHADESVLRDELTASVVREVVWNSDLNIAFGDTAMCGGRTIGESVVIGTYRVVAKQGFPNIPAGSQSLE